MRVRWVVHVVPAGEEHSTQELDCWCCPVWSDNDTAARGHLTRDAALALLDRGGTVVVAHRSVVPEANNVTGPIPWTIPPAGR